MDSPSAGEDWPYGFSRWAAAASRVPERPLSFTAMNGTLVPMKPKVTIVPAGELRANCLCVLDEVERHRTTVAVTERGGTAAQLIPVPAAQGSGLHGTLLYEEDPFAPVDVSWEANARS